VVGSVTQEPKGKCSNQSKVTLSTTQVTTATISPIYLDKTSKINVVQTMTSGKDQPSRNNKKGKR
jgi:hypothetical protein